MKRCAKQKRQTRSVSVSVACAAGHAAHEQAAEQTLTFTLKQCRDSIVHRADTLSSLCYVQARALTEKAVLDLEQQDDMRLQRSVEAGLANAQARVLPEASPSNSQQQDTSQAAATHGSTSSSSSADPAASQSSADASGAQDVDQLQQQQSQNQSPYGKGSTLSDEEKQQAAANSVK